MQTTAITQRQAPAIAFRADRSDMGKIMVIRAPRQWLSERIETCTRNISIHMQPLDAHAAAKIVVRAGQMIIWMFFIEAVLPPTLLPAVGAQPPARCMSEWGDGTNASLGYEVNMIDRTDPRKLCMRYWLTSANILPCEKYAFRSRDDFGLSLIVQHQLAMQKKTANGWIAQDYLELRIIFSLSSIEFKSFYKKSPIACFSYVKPKKDFRSIFDPYLLSAADALAPANLFCETKAAQAATSLAGYTTAVATAVGKTVAMIAQEEEAHSLALRYLLIAIGVSGVVALVLLAYALYPVIKKRLRAPDRAPAESMPLQQNTEAVQKQDVSLSP